MSVHVLLSDLLSSDLRVNGSEVGRAPHLVGVQLVGAPELVAVFLLVHAVKEGVAGFETQFLVPGVGVGTTQHKQSVVCQFHFNLKYIIIIECKIKVNIN